MKFFIDTANIEEIKSAVDLGIIDGVTTNPSLIAKAGGNMNAIIEEICSIIDGPISAEVIATDFEGMLKEGKTLAKIHKNIVVKLPLTPAGIKTCSVLTQENIKTNVTLVFSTNQALLAAKAGATYVSPFVGRLDDIGHNGMQLIQDIKTIFKNYNFKTEILAASIRHPDHMRQASLFGADVATLPYKVILSLYQHTLTDIGLKQFLSDYVKSQN
jgi:transaldolase